VFAYDYKDLQVEEVVGTAARVNNADAKIFGAELDMLFNVTRDFTVNSSVTLLDAQFTKFTNVDLINDPTFTMQDLDGNEMMRSPQWVAVVGGEYTRDIASAGMLVFRIDLSASDSYQLREFENSNDEQDAFTQLNASLRFATSDERWTFALWGKNLTNEEQFYSLVNGNSLSAPGLQGWASGVYSSPRTYGAKVKFAF
jgi:iron complex outermembrane receptor protein